MWMIYLFGVPNQNRTAVNGGRSITIDGPSGAGKSALAVELSQVTGLPVLETGYFIRALVLSPDLYWDKEKVLKMAAAPTAELLSASVTVHAARLAAHPIVRSFVWHAVRQLVMARPHIVVGRDGAKNLAGMSLCSVALTVSPEIGRQRKYHAGEVMGYSGQDLALVHNSYAASSATWQLPSRPMDITVDTDRLSPPEVLMQVVAKLPPDYLYSDPGHETIDLSGK